MIGAIFALGVCFWFYKTAEKMGLSPVPWMVGGVLTFYVSNYVWIYAILRPVAGMRMKSHGLAGGFIIELSGALVGLALVAWFRHRVLLKQQAQE
jgi:hypothetical protein